MSSDFFGRLQTSSGIFGNDRVVFKNPSTPRIKISRLYLRKSWQVYKTCSQVTLIMFCYLQIRTSSSEDSLEPVSSQLLPSNCKVVLLADVDGDGSLKLITGHADRVVHVHKLQADQNTEAGVQEKLLTGSRLAWAFSTVYTTANKSQLKTYLFNL